MTKNNSYTLIIGGSNIDIQGFPYNELLLSDKNPGLVYSSFGGVGRNIAENLSKMGENTKFLSVVGDDNNGKSLLEHAKKERIDVSEVKISKNYPTSSYLSVLDKEGDLKVAISSMDIINEIDNDYIDKNRSIIEMSKLCILDTNLDNLGYIVNNFKATFILDTVSSIKALKAKNLLDKFHSVKTNKLEAEILTGIKIVDKDSIKKAGEVFLEKGVKNLFLTLGEEGVYFLNRNESGFLRAKEVNLINATGAGDAFTAGVAYGLMNELSLKEIAKFAISASIVALEHKDTINPNLNKNIINSKLKNIEEVN